MNTINISLFNSPKEAPTYRPPAFFGATLTSAVIVKNGTVEGNATVDLVFMDDAGQKYVAMSTLRLLEAVVQAAAGIQQRQNG